MNNKYFEIYSKRINRFNILLAILSIFIIVGFFNLQILPHPELSEQIKKMIEKECCQKERSTIILLQKTCASG